MPIHPRLRLSALAALCLCAAACAPPSLPFARMAGLITNGDLNEVSGIAASRVHDDVLWAIEDSGNPARLYALSRRGRILARYRVEGAKNIDWEDLASFDLDGRHYLLVADTGDNGGQRRDFVLHVFEEPATLADGTLRPAWTIRARWPDGPRDVEAVAVDARAGKVLLVSKKRKPPELFVLPLADPGREVQEPRRIGRLAGVPEADPGLQRNEPKLARLSPQVTAADLLKPSLGTITRAGFEGNVEVCVRYLAAWLDGNGCVPIHWLMEDAATAEIARAQLWQWLHFDADPEREGRQLLHLDDGTPMDFALLERVLIGLPSRLAAEGDFPGKTRVPEAIQMLVELTRSDTLAEFLTLPAYERID